MCQQAVNGLLQAQNGTLCFCCISCSELWHGLSRGVQTAQRPSNASTSQLADIVTTIRDEAEHKAASAVAAEIIAAIFERNPTDDPPPAYFRAAAAPDADELAEEGKKIAQVGVSPPSQS